MLKLFTAIISLIITVNAAKAEEVSFDLNTFVDNLKDVYRISVQLDRQDDKQNLYWHLNLPKRYILAEKLMAISPYEKLDNSQFLADKDETYKGVVLQAHTRDGNRFSNIRVHNGRITANDDELIRYDNNRALEFWLLGTAENISQRYVIAQTLQVISFEQCVELGNPIKPTDPRQCLLPTGDILFETEGGITEEALAVNSFDECLLNGLKLIRGVPRKCVAAGGRVFLEPRRTDAGRKLKEYVWE